MEVYSKRASYLTQVLGTYANKSIKCVWFERYGEKYLLTSGNPTKSMDTFLYKMSLSLTLDEMLHVEECLGKASKMATC